MVQPVQIKTQDSYQELQEQRDQIDQSWNLREIADHILEEQDNLQYIKDEFTLISLAHEKYKEQYVQRAKEEPQNIEEPYLGLKDFYKNVKNFLEPEKSSQIAQIDKINQIRDIILTGDLQYEPKNNSIKVQITDETGETQIKYEGPSEPTEIENKR